MRRVVFDTPFVQKGLQDYKEAIEEHAGKDPWWHKRIDGPVRRPPRREELPASEQPKHNEDFPLEPWSGDDKPRPPMAGLFIGNCFDCGKWLGHKIMVGLCDECHRIRRLAAPGTKETRPGVAGGAGRTTEGPVGQTLAWIKEILQ